MIDPAELRQKLKSHATDAGFTMFGVAPAVAATGFSNLAEWIDKGFAGEMDYIANRLPAYKHPDGVLPGTKSIIALAYPYPRSDRPEWEPGSGLLARYTWPGDDYHDVIHPKLKSLCRAILERFPDAAARGVVDTAPLLEREFAQLAGLGWRGKNTLLLNKTDGSYFLLAAVLTTIELPLDEPHQTDHCGRCTACLDACPTKAFPRPGVLDATKCISYLTIEHSGAIDRNLREGIGNWFFGCDICQEVCPWNTKPARQSTPQIEAITSLELSGLFSITDQEFRERFRKTPLWRSRRRGVLRNAAIVLGNQKCPSHLPSLSQGLGDEEPIVREACAWAIGRIGTEGGIDLLRQRKQVETDKDVLAEIDCWL